MLEFGQISPDWRAVVTLMLNENIDCGSGHLSVNRAKQVLKELAKRTGLAQLVSGAQGPEPGAQTGRHFYARLA